MLILTRYIQQKVRINDDITVQVIGINGNQVRIGIEAPKDVPIHREEIYQRLKAEGADLLIHAPPPPPTPPKPDIAYCIKCGCDDMLGCPGGCYWVKVDYQIGKGVCSHCAGTGSAALALWDALQAQLNPPIHNEHAGGTRE